MITDETSNVMSGIVSREFISFTDAKDKKFASNFL